MVELQLCPRIVSSVCFLLIVSCVMNMILSFSGQLNDKPKEFIDKLINGAYFTTTTISTVGYGDLLPDTNFAKGMVAVQQCILILVAFGILIFGCQ